MGGGGFGDYEDKLERSERRAKEYYLSHKCDVSLKRFSTEDLLKELNRRNARKKTAKQRYAANKRKRLEAKKERMAANIADLEKQLKKVMRYFDSRVLRPDK